MSNGIQGQTYADYKSGDNFYLTRKEFRGMGGKSRVGAALGAIGKGAGGAAGAEAAKGGGGGAFGQIAEGLTGIATGLIGGGKRRREQRAAEQELKQRRQDYEQFEFKDNTRNMTNPFEDLTVNQQQAQFEAQQNQQNQANILDSLSGAAGGSGIAALAQQMAQSGQLATQRASASIGAQEAANQKLAAQGAADIQNQERQGEMMSRQMEMDKASTLLGIAQGEAAGAREAVQQARAGQFEAFGNIANSVVGGISAYS